MKSNKTSGRRCRSWNPTAPAIRCRYLSAASAKLVQPPRILKEKHLKLRVVPGDNDGRWQKAHEVIGWRMAERSAQEALALGDVLDLAFTLDYNEHPDFGGLQLTLVDFARSDKATAAASGVGLRHTGKLYRPATPEVVFPG